MLWHCQVWLVLLESYQGCYYTESVAWPYLLVQQIVHEISIDTHHGTQLMVEKIKVSKIFSVSYCIYDELLNKWFACSETGSFKMGNGFVVLIGDGNKIQAGASAVMVFFGFRNKGIAHLHDFCKIDRSIQCHR